MLSRFCYSLALVCSIVLLLLIAQRYLFTSEKNEIGDVMQWDSDTIRVIVSNIPEDTFPVYMGGRRITAGYFAYGAYMNDDGELILLPKRRKRQDTIKVVTKRDLVTFKVPINAGGFGLYYPLRRGQNYHLSFSTDGRMCYSNNFEHQYINQLYQELHDSIQFEGFYSTFRFQTPFMMPIYEHGTWFKGDTPPFPIPYVRQAQKEIDYVHSYIEPIVASDTSKEYINWLKEFAYAQETILFSQAPTLKRYFPLSPEIFQNSFLPIYIEGLRTSLSNISLFEQMDIASYAETLVKADASESYIRYYLSNLLMLIAIEAPRSVFDKNAKQYLELYPKSSLIEYLTKSYMEQTQEYDPSEVRLVDLADRETTLSDILSQLSGDSVIIDLWATWCTPCISDIKENVQKRQQDKLQGIKYIFLAYQDQKPLWEQSSWKLGLNTEEYSFYILNSDANWFQEQKVSRIPMKFFYGKDGKLHRTQVGLSYK